MKKRIKRLKDERMLVKTFEVKHIWAKHLETVKRPKKEKKTVLGVIANYRRSHTEIL